MYCVTVARAPDTQIDMQCIALDLSQGNYFAAVFDGAGVLLPGVTGVGKAADDTAKAVLKFFGKKSAREIEAVKQTFGNGKVVMAYKHLRKIMKGTGLETHHLIEKRFAETIGINSDEILSVAIDKETHKQITKMFRERIGYDFIDVFKNERRTSNATPQEIWKVTREIYMELGMEQYLAPLQQQLINSGANIKF